MLNEFVLLSPVDSDPIPIDPVIKTSPLLNPLPAGTPRVVTSCACVYPKANKAIEQISFFILIRFNFYAKLLYRFKMFC